VLFCVMCVILCVVCYYSTTATGYKPICSQNNNNNNNNNNKIGGEISHMEAASPLVRYRPFSCTHRQSHSTGIAIHRCICTARHGTYAAVSKCEISLLDDGGIHATETCRSKDGSLRTLGSHRVKTCALLLVLFSE
jgi:hypothetical protein